MGPLQPICGSPPPNKKSTPNYLVVPSHPFRFDIFFRFSGSFHYSLVQWHLFYFFFLFLVAAPLKMVQAQKRVPLTFAMSLSNCDQPKFYTSSWGSKGRCASLKTCLSTRQVCQLRLEGGRESETQKVCQFGKEPKSPSFFRPICSSVG